MSRNKTNFQAINRRFLWAPLLTIFCLTVITYVVLRNLFESFPVIELFSYLLAVNVTTFGLYGMDKTLARAQGNRIPEKYLLLFSAIGGSAGALVAINYLRHKSQKLSYQLKLGVILLIQALIIRAITSIFTTQT